MKSAKSAACYLNDVLNRLHEVVPTRVVWLSKYHLKVIPAHLPSKNYEDQNTQNGQNAQASDISPA